MKPNHQQVLIVDSDPKNVRVLLEVLESAGIDVHVRTSGRSALEAFHEIQPDLVLVDSRMYTSGGGPVSREIAKTDRGRATPVILMTSESPGSVAHDKALDASGCATLLQKPLARQELLDTLSRFLPAAFITGPLAGTLSPPKGTQDFRPHKPDTSQPSVPSFDDEASLGAVLDRVFPTSDSGSIAGAITQQGRSSPTVLGKGGAESGTRKSTTIAMPRPSAPAKAAAPLADVPIDTLDALLDALLPTGGGTQAVPTPTTSASADPAVSCQDGQAGSITDVETSVSATIVTSPVAMESAVALEQPVSMKPPETASQSLTGMERIAAPSASMEKATPPALSTEPAAGEALISNDTSLPSEADSARSDTSRIEILDEISVLVEPGTDTKPAPEIEASPEIGPAAIHRTQDGPSLEFGHRDGLPAQTSIGDGARETLVAPRVDVTTESEKAGSGRKRRKKDRRGRTNPASSEPSPALAGGTQHTTPPAPAESLSAALHVPEAVPFPTELPPIVPPAYEEPPNTGTSRKRKTARVVIAGAAAIAAGAAIFFVLTRSSGTDEPSVAPQAPSAALTPGDGSPSLGVRPVSDSNGEFQSSTPAQAPSPGDADTASETLRAGAASAIPSAAGAPSQSSQPEVPESIDRSAAALTKTSPTTGAIQPPAAATLHGGPGTTASAAPDREATGSLKGSAASRQQTAAGQPKSATIEQVKTLASAAEPALGAAPMVRPAPAPPARSADSPRSPLGSQNTAPASASAASASLAPATDVAQTQVERAVNAATGATASSAPSSAAEPPESSVKLTMIHSPAAPPPGVDIQDPSGSGETQDSLARDAAAFTLPEPIRRTPPDYPKMAATMRESGTVKLLVKIGVDGRVAQVRVTRSATPLLDRAAVAAAYTWTYGPAQQSGQSVPAWVEETVDFLLK